MMKKIQLVFGALVVLCLTNILFGIAVAAPSKQAAQSSDKIIAVVNDEVITQSELNNHLAMIKHQMGPSGQSVPQDQELRSKVLDSLIAMTLQLQLAKKNNIQTTDKDVDNAIEMIAKGNNITVAQLKQSLPKSGMSMEAFRNQLKEQITIEKMQQMMFAREITVNDAEVAAIMANPPKPVSTVSAYHIIDVLIPIPDHATAQQSKAAEDAAQKLQDKLPGASDVAKLIKNISVNGQSVTSNDLGWRRLTDMPEIFAAEAVKLSVGQASRPIQAPNGFHVLKLVATQGGAQKVSLTKAQAEQMVFHRKMQEKVEAWVKELRATAYVKINE